MNLKMNNKIIFILLLICISVNCSKKQAENSYEIEVKGLKNLYMIIEETEWFDSSKELNYELLDKSSDSTIRSGFLFWTSDDLKHDDFYVNSYDSIIYVAFSNSKNKVLYFVDLKTNISENTGLAIDKDSIPEEKYKFYQDSLSNAKDAIFKVLYKHNNNLEMTGYNKDVYSSPKVPRE